MKNDTLTCPKCGSEGWICGHYAPGYERPAHAPEPFGRVVLFAALVSVLVLAMGAICSGQERKDKSVLVPTLSHTEADAVGWTFDALLQYPEESRPYIRFVYLPAWADPEWIGAIDLAMNSSVSHSRKIVRGDRFAGGFLLGYNFRLLASDPKRLQKSLDTWDGLAIKDAKFHVPDLDQQGKPVAILAPHLAEALARHVTDPEKSQRIDILLAQITRGTGAVYPAEFVIEQLLSSTRGKYHEFRQWDFKPTNGLTALQNLLKERGYFKEAATDARGDKGAIILRRTLNGRQSVVMTFPGIATNTPATFTFDKKKLNNRPDKHFLRNLVEFEPFHDASEGFLPMVNGGIEYVLANAKGELQLVVPPDIAADNDKPDGHDKELELQSCVICHARADGYRHIPNDLSLLIDSGADYFGEEITLKSGRRLTKEEALDIVVGRFGENIDEADNRLGRARRDYVRFCASLTDYPVKAGEPSAAERVGHKIRDILFAYRYGAYDARTALRENGIVVADGADAKKVFSQVWPPRKGIEDPLIGTLRNGATLTRDDADAIHVELARLANRKQFAGEGK